VVICQERSEDLHMFQLMPLPLTVSCFSKIQIGFAFLVPAHLGSPRKRAVKRVCVCVCAHARVRACVRVYLLVIAFPACLLLFIPVGLFAWAFTFEFDRNYSNLS